MNAGANIPGFLSVKETASRLDVGEHRVYALIRLGDLEACRVSDRSTLVDAGSLAHYQAVGTGAGRPYKQETAMGILWLLSGHDPSWLDYHQLRRCKAAIAQLDTDALKWKCRRRARTVRLRIDTSYFQAAISLMTPSGMSAASHYGFDLVGLDDSLEGYGGISAVEAMKSDCFAVEDTSGNVTVHVTDNPLALSADVMPEAVVALDLAESLACRLKSAGTERLEELLNAQ